MDTFSADDLVEVEVEGNTALRGPVMTEGMIMEAKDVRMIGSIQRRLASTTANGEIDSQLNSYERRELQLRVEKLRAMGDRFASVRLSRFVVPEGAMACCG